jgi:tetratricopeptide (TPR) repeat protein
MLILPLALLVTLAGCQANDQVRRVETPVNVTHEVAFSDYRRVFNTAYHIVNRYGVVQTSSYRYGEITALVSEDTSLWDKTRKTIQARVRDAGDYWEVQCRVLIAIEDSEVATFPDQFQPLYSWKTIASDPQLEVRLNNEIRDALSGGAWQAKEPLLPKARVPAATPRKRTKKRKKSKADADGEVSDRADSGRTASAERPSPEAFERLGVERMRRGEYTNAARAFQAALEADGDSPFAQLLLAQALFSQKKFADAAATLDAGLHTNGEFATADLDLRDFYGSGDSTFTLRLRELAQAADTNPDLMLMLGYMRHFSGAPQGALEAFDAYLGDHPGHEAATRYRAMARAKADDAHGLESF